MSKTLLGETQHTLTKPMALKLYKSITFKFCLAFTFVIVLVVVGVFTSNRISLKNSFQHHIAERTQRELERLAFLAEEIYEQSDSWEPLQRKPRLWGRLLVHALIPPDNGTSSEPNYRRFKKLYEIHERKQERPEQDSKATQQYYRPRPPLPIAQQTNYRSLSLWDANKRFIAGSRSDISSNKFYPIHRDEEVIGYISYKPPEMAAYKFDRIFLQQQLTNSLMIALVAMAITLIIALPLARHLVRPLIRLTAATRAMRAGDYQQRVPVDSEDELGQLSNHFNALAKTLEANDTARRQWVADISHELRTPLAVLKAHIEAIQDGIRPSTPDNIGKLQLKVDELSHLIDDLYQLSLSDLGAMNYRQEAINLRDFFNSLFDSLEPSFQQAGIELQHHLDIKPEHVFFGDEARLQQLFQNLLHNSLNYTDSPGRVLVNITLNKALQVIIEDTAPGVSNEHLPKLFDRLYRVEASRNRQSGGAGLGLAICKNIVEAHNGKILAEKSALGGLKITLTLPLQD